MSNLEERMAQLARRHAHAAVPLLAGMRAASRRATHSTARPALHVGSHGHQMVWLIWLPRCAHSWRRRAWKMEIACCPAHMVGRRCGTVYQESCSAHLSA